MKKWFAFLIILAIGLFTWGCTDWQQSAEIPLQKDETSPSVSKLSSVNPPTASSSSNTAAWPTKSWSISSPEEQNIDTAKLAKADKRIQEHYPNVYSLLVIRHGYLIYEKYYNGMNKSSANPVYSVTKSVTSALTGIAIHQKLIQNVNQKIADLLPEYFKEIDAPEKKNITIANALTMTGGLRSVDNDFQPYYSSPDWMEYALKQPLTAKPGTKFEYNTGLPHFLSVILSKASGMNAEEFADKYLFSKIGIQAVHWDQDSKGYYGGGFGLYLTPRDMAKFGYLYLNRGKWDGESIIPEDWIRESLEKHVAIDKTVDYGYLFWLQDMRDPVSGTDHATYRADGAGGQKIVMVPDLDLIAVITANERIASTIKDGAATEKIISDYVIPAVQ